jgi:hypothetical protein
LKYKSRLVFELIIIETMSSANFLITFLEHLRRYFTFKPSSFKATHLEEKKYKLGIGLIEKLQYNQTTSETT